METLKTKTPNGKDITIEFTTVHSVRCVVVTHKIGHTDCWEAAILPVRAIGEIYVATLVDTWKDAWRKVWDK